MPNADTILEPFCTVLKRAEVAAFNGAEAYRRRHNYGPDGSIHEPWMQRIQAAKLARPQSAPPKVMTNAMRRVK